MTPVRVRRISAARARPICDELLGDEDGGTTWDARGEYVGAFRGTDLVGYGGFVPSRQFADTAYFHTAGVRHSARGNGLQKRLIRARLRLAKRLGYTWAVTYTFPDNPASSASLIACGFRPYWPGRPWAGRQCYWRRRIT